MMEFKLHNGSGGLCCKSCGRQDKQLNTYDWLADIPGNADESELVEVQFKNTRKGYFRNSNKIPLEKGDIVAVEATPGHDIGVVTLTGRLVPLQMKKANIKSEADIKRIYRKAKPVDMEKYNEAKAREHSTMIRSRQIALDLNLNMKIGDVEYQGDGNKAIFYYIADERVDFRQLIKVLADAFRVRIEMKQIGARQEAGRIGGIGPCGRELCCATWMTSFVSVSTSAARFQDISLNPQKLAGQCAKLKCCLNYEVDCYVEAQKRLPSREITLETKDGEFFFFKADILSNQITYSSDLLEQESLTRFDRSRKGKSGGDGNGGENSNNSRNKRKKKSGNGRPQGGEQQGAPQSNNQREQSRQDRQPRQKQDRQAPKQGEQQQGERQQRNNNNRRPPRNNKPKPQGERPAQNDKPAQE